MDGFNKKNIFTFVEFSGKLAVFAVQWKEGFVCERIVTFAEKRDVATMPHGQCRTEGFRFASDGIGKEQDIACEILFLVSIFHYLSIC